MDQTDFHGYVHLIVKKNHTLKTIPACPPPRKLAALLRETNRKAEAHEMEERAREIREGRK
jgi:hypothetical protein